VTLRLIEPSASRNEASADVAERSSHLTCAFINNMPDGAFDSTERQFLGLLDEASEGREIDVRRYTMPGVPRGAETAARIAKDYIPLRDLYLDVPDLLILTGSNPIEVNIEDEPYWSDLVEVLTWSRRRVATTLLSCLSAHAALVVFDGAERVRLTQKCAGVFPQRVDVDSALTHGVDVDIVLPVSRWNSVNTEALEVAGYDVIMQSDVTGWAAAQRTEDGRQLVLVQGHPEYDPSSLLREYRRDAGRYVRGERSEEPALPFHCVSPDDWEVLEAFHRQVVLDQRDLTAFEAFPFDDLAARAPWAWRSLASRFFTNLVISVAQEKD
jgi:homoserine O-succinyltransferase